MDIKPGDTVHIIGSKAPYRYIGPDGAGHRIEDSHGNDVYVPGNKLMIAPPPKPKKVRKNRRVNETDEIPVVSDALLAHLREYCLIRGSGPEKHRPRFEAFYTEATGRALNGQGRHMAWAADGRSFTFHMEVRFPVPVDLSILPEQAHKVPNTHGAGFHCTLYSNALVFELLRQGFDLGPNQLTGDKS